MRRVMLSVLLLASFALPARLYAQETANLPVKRVILYKHGIGYFERRGKVEGDVSLRFKARDMSDLLMSLTVLDLSGGSVRTIDYESTRTVDQQLSDYNFNLRTAQGLPGILDQMKGSEVTLLLAEKEFKGRLLAVEKRLENRNDAQTEVWRLSILLDGGAVRNFDLAEVTEIRFSDPRLQEDLQKYLATLFSRMRRDQKELTILSGGKGERELLVSYIQEQPVWKVSYRLVMTEKKEPLLQAWAIVDNVSEEDWRDVQLTLVSGLPVSFIQNLYDPWYVRRPTVSVQREGAVGPVLYEGGMLQPPKEEAAAAADTAATRGRRLAKGMAPMAERADAVMGMAAPAAAPPPDMLALMAQQATAVAARETGALFQYDIQEPVTVQRDHSALLPIANTAIEAQRLVVYNETTRAANPMESVRLKNTTGLTLEGGAIAVFQDNTYAGEALMDTLKAEDVRLVSFAVDLGTRVTTNLGGSSEQVYAVRILNGVLEALSKRQETKVYTLANIEAKEKTAIIEHPVRPEWKLTDTAKPVDVTPQHYRFEVKLPAKKTVEFKVTEELPLSSSYAVFDVSRDLILLYVQQKCLTDDARKFLEKIADTQAQIADIEAQVAEQERQRNEIFQNQNRTRQNMGVLRQTEEERTLRARYLKEFEEEENQIQAIAKTVTDLKARAQQLRKELEKLVAGYKFETKS